MPPPRSRPPNEAFSHEMRSALTVAKLHVQLLTRRKWPLDAPEREHLVTRLKLVNDAVDRMMRQVIRFEEEDESATHSAAGAGEKND